MQNCNRGSNAIQSNLAYKMYKNNKNIARSRFYCRIAKRSMQGRRSDGRARESKGNARALQTDDEGSEPKIRWIWGALLEMFLRPHPFNWLKMLSRIF